MATSGFDSSSACGKLLPAKKDCKSVSTFGESEAVIDGSNTLDMDFGTELDDSLHENGAQLDMTIWTALDDNLLEKIIARLPFKALFQAQSLSKTWRDTFYSNAFQMEVQHSSTSLWMSYGPLFVSKKNELLGYESSSQQLRRLPTQFLRLSSQEQDVGRCWTLGAGAGSLLCWLVPSFGTLFHLYVSNPFTKRLKRLSPEFRRPDSVHFDLEAQGTTYKVIVARLQALIHRRDYTFFLHIFDSSDGSWSEAIYTQETSFAVQWAGSALVSGTLYMLVSTYEGINGFGQIYKVISYDLKKQIWKNTHLNRVLDQSPHSQVQPMKFDQVYFSKVVTCGSDVMLIIYDRIFHRSAVELSVFRLDLECGLAFELATAPKEMSRLMVIRNAAGHDGCIYIGGAHPEYSCAYNVGTQEWRWINFAADNPLASGSTSWDEWQWASVSYEPGSNPFLEV